MYRNERVGSGIGFFGLLGLLFIGLKLTAYIDWSWLWVLAPIWGPFALFAGITLIWCIVVLFMVIFAACLDWQHERRLKKDEDS